MSGFESGAHNAAKKIEEIREGYARRRQERSGTHTESCPHELLTEKPVRVGDIQKIIFETVSGNIYMIERCDDGSYKIINTGTKHVMNVPVNINDIKLAVGQSFMYGNALKTTPIVSGKIIYL